MKRRIAMGLATAGLVLSIIGVLGWNRSRAPLPERSVKELPAGYLEPSESFLREWGEYLAVREDLNARAAKLGRRIPKDPATGKPMEWDEAVLAFKSPAPRPEASGPASPSAASPASAESADKKGPPKP